MRTLRDRAPIGLSEECRNFPTSLEASKECVQAHRDVIEALPDRRRGLRTG